MKVFCLVEWGNGRNQILSKEKLDEVKKYSKMWSDIIHMGPCDECSYIKLTKQINTIESYNKSVFGGSEETKLARLSYLRFKKDKLKRIIKNKPELEI
jgi:hypothetical protein